MKTNKFVIIFLTLIFLSFHATGDEKRKRKIAIGVSPVSKSNVDGLSAYTFGLSLAYWIKKKEDINLLPDGLYKPSFRVLTGAFSYQIKIWKELSEKEPKKSAYMDQLISVSDAGFMKEYVWAFHFSPAWGAIKKDLKMDKFRKWSVSNLQGHKPRTEARLRLSW